MLTVLAKELYNRGYKNIWIKCDHAGLFAGNPYIKLVIPYRTLLSGIVLRFFKVKIVNPVYTLYQADLDRDLVPDKHIILKMADCLDIKGNINTSPVMILNDEEKAKGNITPKQIVITTSSSGAVFPMRNKEWYADRYQQLVDKLHGTYSFIQLGATTDAPLHNVIDMRGQTTIRESAAILFNAVLMISHVGFMMHLARAVNCRSVVLYGGREQPGQSGYAGFNNIYMAVPCSPCWLHNKCDHQKICMDSISVDMVAQAIMTELSPTAQPLLDDILYNA